MKRVLTIIILWLALENAGYAVLSIINNAWNPFQWGDGSQRIFIFFSMLMIWGCFVTYNVLRVEPEEMAECECGAKCPLDSALLDEYGEWTCPECYANKINESHDTEE